MDSPDPKDQWDQKDQPEKMADWVSKELKETGVKLELQVFQEPQVNMVNQETKDVVEMEVFQVATERREIPVRSVREVVTDPRDLKDFVAHVDPEENPVIQLPPD